MAFMLRTGCRFERAAPVASLFARAHSQLRPCCNAGPAGVPANSYSTFCPPNGASCYFYNRTTANYTVHKAACQARGGYLVAFNSAEEQEAVEAWFVTTTAAMANQSPWIGVEQAGSQWWVAHADLPAWL
jgi:hypothetical protein